eukprot:4583774-Pyramimonas_sp.AAC.1
MHQILQGRQSPTGSYRPMSRSQYISTYCSAHWKLRGSQPEYADAQGRQPWALAEQPPRIPKEIAPKT